MARAVARDDPRRRIGVVLAVTLSSLAAGAPAVAAQPATWRLTEELRIGAEDGPAALTAVSALAVARDGTMYVAESRTGTIRVFDARGRFLRTQGRRGRGPGEFQAIHRIGWKGDTLWTADALQERITLWTPDGRVARTVRGSGAAPRPGARPSAPAVLLADGSVVGDPLLLNFPGRGADSLVLLDAGGRRVRALAAVDGRGRSHRGRVGRFLATVPLPLPHHSLWAPTADGRGVVVVDRPKPPRTGPAVFRVPWALRAGPVAVREIRYAPRPLPPAVRDSIVEAWADGLGEMNVPRGEAVRFARDSLGLGAFQPPVTELVVGRDGSVWLQREAFGGRGTEWTVLDAAGRHVATAVGPAGVRLLAAERDRAWGVVLDELDVPAVVRFRVRPAV